MAQIKVGDRVRYAAAFLRSIGAYTGPTSFARGEVVELQDLGSITLATVQWDSGERYKCNVRNLWPCARAHLEPA